MALSLVVYGRDTCQDTQLVRSRLHCLGVPFAERDVVADPEAARAVRAWNGGSLTTPTLVFGADERIVGEPALAEVDRLARWAGYDVEPPSGTQLHGDVIERSLPSRTLPTAAAGTTSIAEFRGRRQVVLYFPDSTSCLACRSYAHALLTADGDLAEGEALAFAVVAEPSSAAVAWLDGEAKLPGHSVLVDEGGVWRRQIGATVPELPGVGPLVLLLDRWQAPRVYSSASEAGGLMSHAEIGEWLALLAQECSECTVELPWPSAEKSPNNA